jgi:hypothetical protein
MAAGAPGYELHPDEAQAKADGALTVGEHAATVPTEVLTFGFIPDLGSMKPGDIVLVQPKDAPASPSQQPGAFTKEVSGGSIAWHIQQVQTNFQKGAHAQWVHVGLYLGRDLLVEAVTPSVGVNAFSRYAPKHRIKVRRFPNLKATEAHNACVEAMRRIGESYDYKAVIGLAQALLGKDTPKPELIKASFICSELVQKAFLYGASKVVVNVGDERTPTPADLAASPFLRDVDVKWRSVA